MFKPGLAYPIGIDIGGRFIHAAQFSRTRKGLCLGELAVRDLGASPEDGADYDGLLVSAIREMIKNGHFQGKRAILHIPDKNLSVFPIRFQVGRTESLEEAILREAQKHLSFPVEEAIVDYPSISPPAAEKDGPIKATVIAARGEDVDRYRTLIRRAGRVVEAVDFPVCSLIRLHRCIHGREDEPMILCNIGNEQTLFTVLARDSILAQRNIPWGVQFLFKRVAENLELCTEAKNIKILIRTHGLAYDDATTPGKNPGASQDPSWVNMSKAIFQIIIPYMEELVYEFHTMISYARAEEESPVSKGIYLYGCAALINRIDGYLENRLGLPIRVVNPLEHLKLNNELVLPRVSDGAPFSLAIGLAMRKPT